MLGYHKFFARWVLNMLKDVHVEIT
jgi:hypothetical protein